MNKINRFFLISAILCTLSACTQNENENCVNYNEQDNISTQKNTEQTILHSVIILDYEQVRETMNKRYKYDKNHSCWGIHFENDKELEYYCVRPYSINKVDNRLYVLAQAIGEDLNENYHNGWCHMCYAPIKMLVLGDYDYDRNSNFIEAEGEEFFGYNGGIGNEIQFLKLGNNHYGWLVNYRDAHMGHFWESSILYIPKNNRKIEKIGIIHAYGDLESYDSGYPSLSIETYPIQNEQDEFYPLKVNVKIETNEFNSSVMQKTYTVNYDNNKKEYPRLDIDLNNEFGKF